MGDSTRYVPAAQPRGAQHRTSAQLVRTQLRRLPAGAVVGFDVDARARITCLGGELWVTGPDTDDRVLAAGQSLSVVGQGRVVAEALRDARFVVVR